MATAKELRAWATTIRQWVVKMDDARAAEHAARLVAELDRLAECKDAADRQFV
jgi:hypothetical protein